MPNRAARSDSGKSWRSSTKVISSSSSTDKALDRCDRCFPSWSSGTSAEYIMECTESPRMARTSRKVCIEIPVKKWKFFSSFDNLRTENFSFSTISLLSRNHTECGIFVHQTFRSSWRMAPGSREKETDLQVSAVFSQPFLESSEPHKRRFIYTTRPATGAAPGNRPHLHQSGLFDQPGTTQVS